MADNTTINPGVGGDTLRTDDIGGGVKVPVSKIMLGGDGLDTGFVTASNPFPVITMSGSLIGLLLGGLAVSAANPVPTQSVSGSQTGILIGANPVAFSNPLPVSGSIGVLVAGSPVSLANPMPVTGAVGQLFAGSPLSFTNRLPTFGMETTGQILSGSTTRIVQYVNAQVSSGSTQLVAPQGAGLKIRVLAAHVMNTTSNGAMFRWLSTGSAGVVNNLSGYIPLAVSGGFVLPHNPHGWFETQPNEGLNASLNSAGGSSGLNINWVLAS